MARRTKPEEQGGSPGSLPSLQSRLVKKLGADKNLAGVIKQAGGSLLSDTPYYISTQCATLNYALGRPGIPASKVTTIFGREGSGKSSLGYHLLAETQQQGGIAVLADAEQRFPRDRAVQMGLNLDDLIIVEGATLEQAFDAIEKIIQEVRAESLTMPVTVVYDSLAGSVTEKRRDAEVSDVIVAHTARFVSAELPRLKLRIARTGVALVIINQLRSRVDFGSDPRASKYAERNKVMGQKHSMLAEWPLMFESALMIYVNSIAQLGDDRDAPTGIRSRAVIRKCGISPREGWRAEFDIDYMTGIDRLGSKFDLLVELGVIDGGAGGWYGFADAETYGEKKWQRREFSDKLDEFPSLETVIEEAPLSWQK